MKPAPAAMPHALNRRTKPKQRLAILADSPPKPLTTLLLGGSSPAGPYRSRYPMNQSERPQPSMCAEIGDGCSSERRTAVEARASGLHALPELSELTGSQLGGSPGGGVAADGGMVISFADSGDPALFRPGSRRLYLRRRRRREPPRVLDEPACPAQSKSFDAGTGDAPSGGERVPSGTEFGSYRIAAAIAAGAMGTVYRAEHGVLRQAGLHQAHRAEPLLGARAGNPYMVMELLEGEDLERHIEARAVGRRFPGSFLESAARVAALLAARGRQRLFESWGARCSSSPTKRTPLSCGRTFQRQAPQHRRRPRSTLLSERRPRHPRPRSAGRHPTRSGHPRPSPSFREARVNPSPRWSEAVQRLWHPKRRLPKPGQRRALGSRRGEQNAVRDPCPASNAR